MNKYDWLLILIIISFVFVFYLTKNNEVGQKAIVKYAGDIVLEIDLTNLEKRKYEVMGDLGPVVILVENGKIGVIEETSPLNICSKRDFTNQSNDVIVCLPNQVIIEILGESEIDAIIR